MKFRIFLVGALIAALLQTGALAKIIYDRAELLQNGQEVVLETGFVDPRDLFRGHYVTLNLVVSRVEAKTLSKIDDFSYYDTIYLELEQGEGLFAAAKAVTTSYPENASGPAIKGTARTTHSNDSPESWLSFRFPFDRYFAPKLRAKELEKLRGDRKLGIILMLDSKGNGAIKGITIDGEKVYEEPLF
ncbi:MAG: GDYXXLXY domain-containing protein [Rhodobacteraceae bacterium]|nr:GDYXXLXY domain-containing protein [Paracoccaceae bacterium]